MFDIERFFPEACSMRGVEINKLYYGTICSLFPVVRARKLHVAIHEVALSIKL
jgi:hypothetical protein